MSDFIEIYLKYRYLSVPFLTWIGIQLFKVIWDLLETKKINIKRLWGSGGMPSAHSAVVASITTMIGRGYGLDSPLFAISFIFALVVIYDACGVRYEVGKQAHVLNEIRSNHNFELTGKALSEKLEELVGHTPFQVLIGALIGVIIGFIF